MYGCWHVQQGEVEMKLDVKNLSFDYNKRPVFRDISFSIETGDILFLLGPNGVGKTTLFKVILGLLKPKNGQIFIDAQEISRWSRKNFAKNIGYVPQIHNAYFSYTVLDVVLMGRTPYISNYSSPSKKDVLIACEALEFLNILHLKDEKYTHISAGERQLVLISRALTQKPKILILDEPTSSLDYGNQIKVLQHIKQLAGKDIGIIISTHVPDHAVRYATKVILMKDGRVLSCGDPKVVINPVNLKEIYNVDTRMINVMIDHIKSVSVFVPYQSDV